MVDGTGIIGNGAVVAAIIYLAKQQLAILKKLHCMDGKIKVILTWLEEGEKR